MTAVDRGVAPAVGQRKRVEHLHARGWLPPALLEHAQRRAPLRGRVGVAHERRVAHVLAHIVPLPAERAQSPLAAIVVTAVSGGLTGAEIELATSTNAAEDGVLPVAMASTAVPISLE